jgi:hypothetical protein
LIPAPRKRGGGFRNAGGIPQIYVWTSATIGCGSAKTNYAFQMHKREPDHFLINNRVAATIGLIGLGGTFGLTLMTARILPYVGFAASLLCSLAVFWIYAKSLRTAYRSIAKRIRYNGPPARELLIASSCAALLVVLSGWVLSIVLINASPNGRAVLETGLLEFVKIPSTAKAGFINISIKNTGSLDANNARILVLGHIAAADLPMDAVKKELDDLASALSKMEASKIKLGLHPQIRAGTGIVVTLEDIRGDEWVKLAEGSMSPRDRSIQVTDEQWAAFQRGDLAIYVLYVVNYEDDGHAGTSYWSSRQCTFTRGAVNYSHQCDDNRIELISHPR